MAAALFQPPNPFQLPGDDWRPPQPDSGPTFGSADSGPVPATWIHPPPLSGVGYPGTGTGDGGSAVARASANPPANPPPNFGGGQAPGTAPRFGRNLFETPVAGINGSSATVNFNPNLYATQGLANSMAQLYGGSVYDEPISGPGGVSAPQRSIVGIPGTQGTHYNAGLMANRLNGDPRWAQDSAAAEFARAAGPQFGSAPAPDPWVAWRTEEGRRQAQAILQGLSYVSPNPRTPEEGLAYQRANPVGGGNPAVTLPPASTTTATGNSGSPPPATPTSPATASANLESLFQNPGNILALLALLFGGGQQRRPTLAPQIQSPFYSRLF